MKAYLFAVCLLLTAGCAIGQQRADGLSPAAPAELRKLHEEFHAAMKAGTAALEKRAAPLKAAYVSTLERMQVDATRRGDLDGALAIREEKKRVKEGQLTTDEHRKGMSGALRMLRAEYESNLRRLNEEVVAYEKNLRQRYVSDLEALQNRIVVRGELDPALAVKEEQERQLTRLAEIMITQGWPSSLPLVPKKLEDRRGGSGWLDKTNPARVEVDGVEPEVLQASPTKELGRWKQVPDALQGAKIYSKDKRPGAGGHNPNPKHGAIDVTVLSGGRVYVVCNYNYQGNESGGWTEERWSKDDFLRKGWSLVRGLDLVPWNGSKDEIVVFTKTLAEGSKLRLRCNKYSPPFLLTF